MVDDEQFYFCKRVTQYLSYDMMYEISLITTATGKKSSETPRTDQDFLIIVNGRRNGGSAIPVYKKTGSFYTEVSTRHIEGCVYL